MNYLKLPFYFRTDEVPYKMYREFSLKVLGRFDYNPISYFSNSSVIVDVRSNGKIEIYLEEGYPFDVGILYNYVEDYEIEEYLGINNEEPETNFNESHIIEALDRLHIQMTMIEEFLMNHPAILKADVKNEVLSAQERLKNAYQAVSRLESTNLSNGGLEND